MDSFRETVAEPEDHEIHQVRLPGEEQAERPQPELRPDAPAAARASLAGPGEHRAVQDESPPPELGPGQGASAGSRKRALVVLAGLLAAGATTAGGLYLRGGQPALHLPPFPPGIVTNGATLPVPVHPGDLPAAAMPATVTGPTFPADARRATRQERVTPVATPFEAELAEITALRASPSTAIVTATPIDETAPEEMPPAAASIEAVPAPALATVRPADPVAVAAKLEPAAMTPPVQVDILQLVTELGVLVRDMRTENAQLRESVAALTTTVETRTTDFDQRLALAEAKGAIAAAMGAGAARPVPAIIEASTMPAAPAELRPAPRPAATAAVITKTSGKDYRIQAASPGLALLATGDGGGLEVAIGDDVPGAGVIQKIFQKGTRWVVQTDRTTIE